MSIRVCQRSPGWILFACSVRCWDRKRVRIIAFILKQFMEAEEGDVILVNNETVPDHPGKTYGIRSEQA